METGRVLAIDPGEVRIGVAVSDSARTMGFPRDAVKVDSSGLHLQQLAEIVREEGAAVVVVGLPRALAGREGAAARSARALAGELAGLLDPDAVEVVLHDERLTTVEASAALRSAGRNSRQQRSSIDSAAAAVLLEDWIRCR